MIAQLQRLETIAKLAHPSKQLDELDRFMVEDYPNLLRQCQALQAAAQAVVAPLEAVGDELAWAEGDETDRVYAWYEIKPLRDALEDCG